MGEAKCGEIKKNTCGQVAHTRKPKYFSPNVGQKTEKPKVQGKKALRKNVHIGCHHVNLIQLVDNNHRWCAVMNLTRVSQTFLTSYFVRIGV